MEVEREKQKIDLIQALTRMPELQDTSDMKTLIFNAVLNGGQEVTCNEFVAHYLKHQNVEIQPNGIYHNNDLVRNHKAFFHKLHQSYKEYKKAFSLKNTFSREELALEVESILEDSWNNKRIEMRKVLQPAEDTAKFDKLLTKLTNAICGNMVPDKEHVDFRLAKAFLAHFFWQIVMRLHHGPRSILDSGNQAILMLVSPKQKTGKSTTARHMVQIFEDFGFVWRATLDRLADSFSYGNLAYNYVAIFDDMHRSSNLNMGNFKQIITQDEVHFRSMHTQTEMKLPQVATLIGTSNKTPRELMNDTSGLRRFHQILVNNGDIHSGEGIDLDFISNFDFVEFIRHVPLEKKSPLFNYVTERELSDYEESIRPLHLVEHWLNDCGYSVPELQDTAELLSTKELYDQMRIWARDNGYNSSYTPTAVSLTLKLQELGYKRGRNRAFRGFYVEQRDVNG